MGWQKILQTIIRMKKNKRTLIKKTTDKKGTLSGRLRAPMSQYSQKYRRYMIEQYPTADLMIKKLIQLPCCRQYYLKFPLQGLLRGVVKKLMLNSYELIVYSYFLEQIESWNIGNEIYSNLCDVFPDIIHVNQPTSQQQLKQLSMFLYFSSYSVKQFLNSNIEIYRQEMQKIFTEFQHLHIHWVNSQPTVNLALNPRTLNQYYKKLGHINNLTDYNTCVDKIIQISPCYDLSGRNQKVRPRDFGYMQTGSKQYLLPFNNLILNNGDQGDVKVETDQIDFMGDDFKFDGRNI